MTAVAGAIQLVLAVTFLLAVTAVYRDGGAAQRALEAEAARQGIPGNLLADQGVRLEESVLELMLPVGIAAILLLLGVLNLAGTDLGRLLTWIGQPILLVGGGLITAGQVFADRYVAARFSRADDGRLRDADVQMMLAAARRALPVWLRPVVVARFVLTTAGSVAVLLLLATS